MTLESNIPWSITAEEKALARHCLDLALQAGASGARLTLMKSLMDLFQLRNGELEKVTHAGDRSISFYIIAEGRAGVFSTNKLEEADLKAFLQEAVATVRMLAPDPCAKLTAPERIAHDAVTGLEMKLYDPAYADMTPDSRLALARRACAYGRVQAEGCRIISEETEYSDSISSLLILGTNGMEALHIESSFELGCEYTVEDAQGRKVSGFWWHSAPLLKDLDIDGVCPEALRRAEAQLGAGSIPSGRYTMVVENDLAPRLLAPVLSALGGSALQQKNSFLTDSLGKALFPAHLTVWDQPLAPGCSGARLFDSEGAAAANRPIIEKGVVKNYFLSEYYAGKMGMSPTATDSLRACVSPCWTFGEMPGQITRDDILRACGKGIYVTGFNGGNCNTVTGDFSYGIEGFAFQDGRMEPVHGMVATGNILRLWNNLVAAGTDARPCRSRMVPTLAFKDIDFSA